MFRLTSTCLGLCLSLAACSGTDATDDTQSPTAGSAGVAAGAGDAPVSGGAPAQGGAPNQPGGSGGTPGDGTAGASPVGGSGGGAQAGSGGSSGGAAGSSGSAGSGGGSTAPIDYSIWRLELPIGSGSSPTTVSPKMLLAGFTNAYFYTAPDGGQMFMDPKTGISFSGSVHPRSEMRESTPDDQEAAWKSSGTNTMTVTGKGVMLSGGKSGSTTVAQVFVSGSNTLCELQYNGTGMKLFYEESKGNGESPVDLKTSIPLNTKYTFVLGYSKNVLTVTLNGKQVYSRTPSSAVSGKTFFFKVGNYDQTADPGTPTTTPYTQIEVYSVAVSHS